MFDLAAMAPWLLLLGLTAGAGPFVAVGEFGPVSTTDEGWIGPRAQELLVDRLRALGLDAALVRGRPTEVPPGFQGLVIGGVEPERVDGDATPIQLRFELRSAQGAGRKVSAKGKAEALPTLITQAALQLAAALEQPVPPDAEPRLLAAPYPYAVEQLLGRARARLLSREARQASLLYERAQRFGGVVVPEAIVGRVEAQAQLLSASGGEFSTKGELAQAAAERAQAAAKRGDRAEEETALLALLQFLPDRALRYRWIRPFTGQEVVREVRGRWRLAVPAEGRIELDPRTGVVLSATPLGRGWVGSVDEEELFLEGNRLVRRGAKETRPRFVVDLPITPRGGGPQAVVDCGSAWAVLGDEQVAWIDPVTGQLGQVARSAKPMAFDAAGVLIRPGNDDEVGLLRPGKRTTAWRTPVPSPLGAELTRDRVVLLTTGGLLLLRTHDGKPVRPALALGLESPRLLGADGRYAAVGDASGQVVLIDVLGGELTGRVKGPGPAVGAYSSSDGLGVLFEGGDLLFLDRDGKLRDRALVPGRPLRILRGSPEAPGPVVLSDRGLYAYAEAELTRDRGPWLQLGRLLEAKGEPGRALALYDHLAEEGAGDLAAIEGARARLIRARGGALGSAERAEARARCAEDPTCPLSPFAL